MKTAQPNQNEIRGRNPFSAPSGDALPAPTSFFQQLGQVFGRLLIRILRGESRAPSILRNNTNLPLFFIGALALSLACNFALKQSSAQASRYHSPAATVEGLLQQLRQNPDNASLHSRIGEFYLQQRQFKRAMFHLREASRIGDFSDE